MTTNEMTPADLAAVTGGNDCGFGGNSAWWIIILFLFAMFGAGGNGLFGGNTAAGAAENYVLASDFATLQRQIDSAADGLRQQSNQISNGLCDGFFNVNTTLLNGFSGVNSAVAVNGYETRNAIQNAQIGQMQGVNAIQSQIAQNGADTREAIAGINYNLATNSCATQNAIAMATRDITDNQNSNTRAILDALNTQQVDALKAQIAAQNQQIFGLQLAASQCNQNAYLINAIRPSPVPSYPVPAPYAFSGGCTGCSGG